MPCGWVWAFYCVAVCWRERRRPQIPRPPALPWGPVRVNIFAPKASTPTPGWENRTNPTFSPRAPGTKVIDPYRWMEDRHDPQFLAWARGQNDYARATLAAIPNRGKLLQRIEALDSASTLVRGMQLAPGLLIYEKRRPGDDVYKLYVR